jgi:Na+/H+ antiporter NhaD/arsenite permease-like protein
VSDVEIAVGVFVVTYALIISEKLPKTTVAASANVLVANLAARSGHKVTFMEFFRYGAMTTLGMMLISTAYLWARYLAF